MTTLEVASFKTTKLLTGRALLGQATQALCEMKKALAFVQDHLDKEGNPIKSGETPESIITALLDFMWLEQSTKKAATAEKKKAKDDSTSPPKKKQKVQVANDSKDGTASDEKVTSKGRKRPDDWVFKGFMAFYFFGPFAENRDADRCIDLLLLCDPPKDKQSGYGRNSQRKGAAKAAAFDRERDANRGMSPLERMLANQEINAEKKRKQSKQEAILMSLNLRASRCQNELKMAFEYGKLEDDYDDYKKLKEKMREYDCEIQEMEKLMQQEESCSSPSTASTTTPTVVEVNSETDTDSTEL